MPIGRIQKFLKGGAESNKFKNSISTYITEYNKLFFVHSLATLFQ